MTTDASTTVGLLRQAVADFVNNRDWRPFHTPKNLSMSIAIEAAELMERFQWLTTEGAVASMRESEQRTAVSDELADITIYCLSLANSLDLDISSAVLDKLKVNEHRYPVDKFRGRFRQPERDR